MKTTPILIILLFTLYAVNINSQTLLPVDGKVIYENLQLEREGSSMVLSFDTRVAEKALNNRQSWEVIPELIPSGTGKSVVYPSLLINGRQKERHYNRRMSYKNKELLANQPLIHASVPQEEEQLIRYRAEIPYEPWMENSSLTFHQLLTSPREKKQLFTTAGVARLVPAPKPTPQAPPVVIPLPTTKILTIHGEAHIRFVVGKTDIRPAYMGNQDELEKIEKEIRRIMQDESLTLVSIRLTGYASPEGSLALNEQLSAGRTRSLKAYLADKYRLDPATIRTASVPEDWERLRRLVEKSELKNKTDILAIIDSGESEDTKEQKLRALPATWNTLLREYFPQLRRVDYEIEYTQEITN